MTFKIGAAFGASGGSHNYNVVSAVGTVLATGTTRPSGSAAITVTGVPGDEVYFVLSDGREAGPLFLDNPVADAVTAIDNINPGTGARTLTFTVLDQDLVPVERATVRVTAGLITKSGETDVNGGAEIPVDDGTWHFAVDKAGYDGATGTRVVTGDLAISATLISVVIPIVPSPGLVTVYGSYGFLDVFEAGIPVMASIRGNGPIFLDDTLQNTERSATTETSEGGVWSLDLAPLPDGFFWELSVGSNRLKLDVPRTPGVALAAAGIIAGN